MCFAEVAGNAILISNEVNLVCSITGARRLLD